MQSKKPSSISLYPDSVQVNYYYQELDKKNQQIQSLKNRVVSLIDEKNSLLNEITSLKQQNYNISASSEQQFINLKTNFEQKEKNYLSVIYSMKNENNILKKNLNQKMIIENNFNNTLAYKLSTAKKEIQNLSIMNSNKDNIIFTMQKLLKNIQKTFFLDNNKNSNLIFDIKKIDHKKFIENIVSLENEIKMKLGEPLKFAVINKDHINKNEINNIDKINENEKCNLNIYDYKNDKIERYSLKTYLMKRNKSLNNCVGRNNNSNINSIIGNKSEIKKKNRSKKTNQEKKKIDSMINSNSNLRKRKYLKDGHENYKEVFSRTPKRDYNNSENEKEKNAEESPGNNNYY